MVAGYVGEGIGWEEEHAGFLTHTLSQRAGGRSFFASFVFMILPRLLIFGIPLVAGLVAWWSADQARKGRLESRTHLVALLPQPDLTWNPFQRVTEGERQILDLVHEPLLTLDREGRVAPALARSWLWTQRVHCWFSDAKTARTAAERLSALKGNRWMSWNLESAESTGMGLNMSFSDVDGAGAAEALKVIEDLKPQPAKVLQVSVTKSGKPVFNQFRKSKFGRQIQRVWWDDDLSAEMLILGNPKEWAEALIAAFRTAEVPLPEMRLIGELTGLREPVLEFELRDGVRWHSGDRVTLEDVKATVDLVKRRGWALSLERGFRDLQKVELAGENVVRMVYRNFYGPALMDWVRLPILPREWLAEHAKDEASLAFSSDPPPGAGPFQLTRLDNRVLALSAVPRDGEEPLHRQVRILTGAGPFVMHMAFATGGADVVWPGQERMEHLLEDPELELRSAPLQGRLMVLWNTQAPLMGDGRLREALDLATDRQALIDDLLDGRGRMHGGLFRPDLWYAQDRSVDAFDLGRAQRLLAQSGWLVDVNGRAKKPDQSLTFSLITTAGSPQRERLASLLAKQWSKLGVKVNVEVLPSDEWALERLPRGRFDGVILGMDYGISWDQTEMWHSTERAPAGLNFSGVATSAIDLQLDALAMEFDLERVPERAAELEELILARRPMLSLFTDRQDIIVRSRLLPDNVRERDGSVCTLRDLLLSPKESPVNPGRLRMRVPEVEMPVEEPQLKMRVPEEDAS
jgi:ABC-type transport system substrate-binding protein